MNEPISIRYVIKFSGKKESFIPNKIADSIWMAAQNVGGKDRSLAHSLGRQVTFLLVKNFSNGEDVSSYEIGELVEKVLIENGHTKTAKEFIRYRENKKHIRKDKSTLGVKDDIGLSYNTLYILKNRYLKRNKDGNIVETPREMLERVARFISSVEKGKKLQEKYFKEFFNIMIDFEFLPGSRTLANAGKKTPQLANCFVWPMEDDIDGIFDILHKSTLIKKHGGGCGYNFSKIRPQGDVVSAIPGLAAGPVKMIEMFDLMTSMFKQEGKYESGNMAILNADHPDIFHFISAKQADGYLSKTNISVGITDEFMHSVLKDGNWNLINPRSKEVVNTVKARSILQLISSMAWQTGDPGIIHLSTMNKGTKFANPLLKKRGEICATNPCGEVPLYPYESCNLGYINFVKFVKNGKFNFSRFKKVVSITTRFMDNVIDASWFPVKEVDDSVRKHRRLGIGCVGWAETLSNLEIPYDSEEAFSLAEKIVRLMYTEAFRTSCQLAQEKGPFPLIKDSIWADKKKKPRNVALLTFPPSSGNAVICETSFGIEPYFALAYEQNVLDGMRLNTVVPAFTKKLKERGIYSELLIEKIIQNHGSIQSISIIPKDLKAIFKTAHDIHWKDHIKMQSVFQKWTDNAITKTINMPSSATPKDVEDAYILSWKLGCKGLTIYRDQTKKDQVFNFGGSKKKEKIKCPTCDITLEKDGNCHKCTRCGFSTCEL